METVEDLESFLQQIGADGLRGRLQARGETRTLIRHDGTLPEGAPPFSSSIDVDLAEVGFSLLRAALALREAQGSPATWRQGFVRAGNAFEALVQNGPPTESNRSFNRVMGAAAYHLAGYTALAFSLMIQGTENSNLAPAEEAITLLLIRDLDRLADSAKSWLLDPSNSDVEIVRRLEEEEIDPDDAVTLIVTSTIYRGFSYFQFALQTGSQGLVNNARQLLNGALNLSKNANAVSLWWISRVALNLIDDLWSNSLHQTLPKTGPTGAISYERLRRLFLGELFSRKTSEIELWPSQISAAQRAVDLTDDLGGGR